MNYFIRLRVLADRNATVASATVLPGLPDGTVATATGSAKREHGDVYDPAIATRLAVSRALEQLARDLRRDAHRRILTAADKQTRAELRAGLRRLRREKVRAGARKVLPISEIQQQYGDAAAERAERRRGR